MKVDELVKELRLRATHVPERQQFASHAMSHAADWLEAYAKVVSAYKDRDWYANSERLEDRELARQRLKDALLDLSKMEIL